VQENEGTSTSRPHAARQFALRLPVWYRIGDEGRWRLGLTERVSVSEIVIRAGARLAGILPVTLVVSLPFASGDGGGCLVAHGCLRQGAGRMRGTLSVLLHRSRLEPTERVFDPPHPGVLRPIVTCV